MVGELSNLVACNFIVYTVVPLIMTTTTSMFTWEKGRETTAATVLLDRSVNLTFSRCITRPTFSTSPNTHVLFLLSASLIQMKRPSRSVANISEHMEDDVNKFINGAL